MFESICLFYGSFVPTNHTRGVTVNYVALTTTLADKKAIKEEDDVILEREGE